MAAAQKTRQWRANLRNQLGDDAYLARQRDQKRVYRARRRAEEGLEPARARNGVRCECKCEGQQAQQAPQPLPQQAPQQAPQPPPRPATRPSAEVIKQLLSKYKNPPAIPEKAVPGAVKKLQLLLKQLNVQKNNKND